jgi:predicted ATP-grasp superfamily ATP-dependent carboligase
MEGVKIYKKPALKDPYLIVAWPGMGDVAFKTAVYLVEKTKAQEFAEIEPKDFFYLTGSVIEKGILALPQLPYGKFYYYKNKLAKNDFIVFISNAQPDLAKAKDYCERIIYLAKTFKIKSVIALAALPQAIDYTQQPDVWFAATGPSLVEDLKKEGLNELKEGQVSGMNGLFLGNAKKAGLEGFCLLSEIPLYTIQIENPKASLAALTFLTKIINVEIDFTDIREQAHNIEEEINKLFGYLKLNSPVSPIGEEEIEKIKKSLSQLTKLPGSIKEKIEELFVQVKGDISKANELKSELDKWNVYKEYEDRFLDLFKKSKDTSN